MPLLPVRRNSQGFTLIETLIVVVVIGILSAIAAPSFLGMLNRAKVNDALTQVKGALQEAQREAIRRSRSCEVTLTTSSVTSPCFVTGTRTLPNGVQLLTDISGSKVTFSFRGNTANGGVTVLKLSNGSTEAQKCIVTSVGIGLIRIGNYSGTPFSGTCNTSQ